MAEPIRRDPGRRAATYADLEAVPEPLVAEIIDGELVTHPRPSPRHGSATSVLGARLMGSFQFDDGGPGGWICFDEPELHLGRQIVVPDIAGWRSERLLTYPDTSYFEVRPDWVCEVLSASTDRRDRTVKSRIYAEAGIPYFWIIDPRQQMLEAFELDRGSWRTIGGWLSDAKVRVAPFDAIAISLAELWPLDRPLGFAEDPQALYAGDR